MTISKDRRAYEVIERDRKGHEIRALRDEEQGPRDGFNVVLTIDQVIQHVAEQELDKAMVEFKPQAGVIIISRLKTGRNPGDELAANVRSDQYGCHVG